MGEFNIFQSILPTLFLIIVIIYIPGSFATNSIIPSKFKQTSEQVSTNPNSDMNPRHHVIKLQSLNSPSVSVSESDSDNESRSKTNNLRFKRNFDSTLGFEQISQDDHCKTFEDSVSKGNHIKLIRIEKKIDELQQALNNCINQISKFETLVQEIKELKTLDSQKYKNQTQHDGIKNFTSGSHQIQQDGILTEQEKYRNISNTSSDLNETEKLHLKTLISLGSASNGKTFFMDNSIKRSWAEAKRYATALDMKLAEILTKSESDFIKNIPESLLPSDSYWTGGIRNPLSRYEFKWDKSGGPLISYSIYFTCLSKSYHCVSLIGKSLYSHSCNASLYVLLQR